MRRYLSAAAAAVLAIAMNSPAAAATIRYTIFGNCDGTCSNVGMNRGDLIFGSLTLDRPSITIGGTFDETNLTDFSVRFGANTITKASSAGVSLTGVWGDDLDSVAAMDLRAATALAPGSGLGLVLMLGSSIVSTSGSCATAACDGIGWTSASTLSGVTLRATPGPGPTPVPLPPALGLLAAGVGALAVAARGRRAGGKGRAAAPVGSRP